MAKVPKIQCSTILRMVFFIKNKELVTKKRWSRMTTEIGTLMTQAATLPELELHMNVELCLDMVVGIATKNRPIKPKVTDRK